MKFEMEVCGNIFDGEWKDETNFEELDGQIKGALGFIFNEEGKVCIVNCKEKQGWTFPGGSVEEYDKSYEETFIREADEEGDLELKEIQRLGYITAVKRKEKIVNISLRFIAKVKKLKDQTLDPATGRMPKRKFVDPNTVFDKYVKWDSNGRYQIKKALEKINEK